MYLEPKQCSFKNSTNLKDNYLAVTDMMDGEVFYFLFSFLEFRITVYLFFYSLWTVHQFCTTNCAKLMISEGTCCKAIIHSATFYSCFILFMVTGNGDSSICHMARARIHHGHTASASLHHTDSHARSHAHLLSLYNHPLTCIWLVGVNQITQRAAA